MKLNMTLKNLPVLVMFAWLVQSAFALKPPLAFVLKDVFDNRKPGAAVEVVLKHTIELKGEKIEIEERIVRERGQTRITWKIPGGSVVPATYERAGYVIARDHVFPSRTGLFIKYLTYDNSDDFRDQLIAEQFIRRDQLFQYKPGFIPTGDPQTWNMPENYMKHSDIFLSRLSRGIAVAVVGMQDAANRRSVFFDLPKKGSEHVDGVYRLEWKEDNQVVAWNFDTFVKSGDGFYPRHGSFEVGGVELINTQVLAWRALRDKALSDSRNQWKALPRGSSLPASVEAGLKLLLSYR